MSNILYGKNSEYTCTLEIVSKQNSSIKHQYCTNALTSSELSLESTNKTYVRAKATQIVACKSDAARLKDQSRFCQISFSNKKELTVDLFLSHTKNL